MRATVAWIITAIWAAGYTRRLFDPNFPVPVEITPVMLLAAGYLFGKDVKEKLRERVRQAVNEDQDVASGDQAHLPRAKGR